MRLLHPSLGLTALVAAFAVGLRTEEGTIVNSANSLFSGSPYLEPDHPSLPPASQRILSSSSRTISQREPLPDPRLEELTNSLALSHAQQAKIHPAIIRATFAYDPKTPYSLTEGKPAIFLGPPLTRADFEDALFAILDVEQQLDYAATATEKEAWWQSVISRLEADLESQTSPAKLPPSVIAPSLGRDRQLQLPPVTD